MGPTNHPVRRQPAELPYTVHQTIQQTVIENGVGLGAVIAVVASWSRNQSILWAILHGICSWFYVIYFALTRTPGPPRH